MVEAPEKPPISITQRLLERFHKRREQSAIRHRAEQAAKQSRRAQQNTTEHERRTRQTAWRLLRILKKLRGPKKP